MSWYWIILQNFAIIAHILAAAFIFVLVSALFVFALRQTSTTRTEMIFALRSMNTIGGTGCVAWQYFLIMRESDERFGYVVGRLLLCSNICVLTLLQYASLSRQDSPQQSSALTLRGMGTCPCCWALRFKP